MLLETCADLEPLVDRLAQRLRTPLTDPMAQEIIVVPVADMANYLKRELGQRLGDAGKNNGIVANIDFIYPRELINATANKPTGVSRSPWDATRLTWSVMSLVRNNSSITLPRSFTNTPLSSARRVAELFDRYASHRPEMLRGWADGHKYDVSSNGIQDWQVNVFESLNAHIRPVEYSQRSVVDIDAFASQVQKDILPARISVFGIDALSRAATDVIGVLDSYIDVAVYWLYAPGDKMPTAVTSGTARNEYAQTHITHPLYARWSAHVLESRALVDAIAPNDSATIISPLPRTSSLLHSVQTGIITDSGTTEVLTEKQIADVIQHGDGSIQIHACYGLHRQVEALRDALLHALNDDPTLRLRDILIVCSDVAAAAPVLHSVLDPDNTVGENVPRLPINVLRGAVTRPDEVTQAFLEVLQLATGRCSTSQLLDVASLAPVRRAFSLDDNALELLQRWTEHLGVQFGLTTDHRKKWNLADSITNGTWQVAMERLMMGVAVPSERDLIGPGDVVPYDAISTSELILAGTLAEFLTRVETLHNMLHSRGAERALSLATWNHVLVSIIDNFINVVPSASESLARLRRAIGQMYADASAEIAIDEECFSLRDFLLITNDYITNSVSDFWSQFESITVADFGGMNHVPFKVIAFVGADESAFAGNRADGDDVLSNEARVGEPQYSLQGRENLMNLLMSARSAFIITCTGADIRNNKDTPLAVPVQELLEHVASFISSHGTFGDHRVFVHHGRHNFDTRTLRPGYVRHHTPFTFDANSCVVWETLHSDTEVDEYAQVAAHLTAEMPEIRDIQQLLRIISNPVSYYYKDILNVDIPEGPSNEVEFTPTTNFDGDGVLALTLSSLAYSAEGRRLLQLIANFDGPHDDGWLDHVMTEWQQVRPLTGLLPPGRIGELISAEISTEVQAMIKLLPPELQSLQGDEVDCVLPLAGNNSTLRIADVVSMNDTSRFARARFKRFTDSLLLEMWVEVATLTMYQQGKTVIGYLVTRNSESAKSNPVCYQVTMRGKSNDERIQHAQQALSAMSAFATIASQTPVDFFAKTSRVIAGKVMGNVHTALKDDTKYNPELSWYLDNKGVTDLRQIKPSQEELAILQLDSSDQRSSSRIEMYSSHIWDAFDQTCSAVLIEGASSTTNAAESSDGNHS
jgi:exodeoxyribonuclease V gamma subunit